VCRVLCVLCEGIVECCYHRAATITDISHPGLADNATLVTPSPTLVALQKKGFTTLPVLRSQVRSTVPVYQKCQRTSIQIKIMMLYYACLAAYDDTSDTHTSKYQPPIAYTPRWDWTIEGAGWGDAECLAYFRLSKSEIRELIVHLKSLCSIPRTSIMQYYACYYRI